MQGRSHPLHGANPATPVTIVEDASRATQQIIATTLAELPGVIKNVVGPALTFYGLAPRAAMAAAETLNEKAQAQ